MSLQGYVDCADQFFIAGWAVDHDNHNATVLVRIVQQGKDVLTIQPWKRSDHVVRALNLTCSGDARHVWRLVFPLANGLRPDLPFSVVFDDNDQPLEKGTNRVIPLAPGMEKIVATDLDQTVFLAPEYRFDGSRLLVSLLLYPPAPIPLAISVLGEHYAVKPVPTPPVLGRNGYYVRVEFDPQHNATLLDNLTLVELLPWNEEHPRQAFNRILRSIAIPPAVFDKNLLQVRLPAGDNQKRVSGPSTTDLSHLIGGATTWIQLDRITTRYFGCRLTEFECVADWGCGCGRVLRHFVETAPFVGAEINKNQLLIGLDIDDVNIAWCTQNMTEIACFERLSLTGFRLADSTVDLLYGISVMTHLTEVNQKLWLREIARIVKPGGCVILTIHGEYATYRIPDNIALPFMDLFGFFDALPDAAIGTERKRYYRATFQSRGHVMREWANYFEVLDVIPAANSFIQDFVVLRRF